MFWEAKINIHQYGKFEPKAHLPVPVHSIYVLLVIYRCVTQMHIEQQGVKIIEGPVGLVQLEQLDLFTT